MLKETNRKSPDVLVSIGEARVILGVSHNTMLKIFGRERITPLSDPLDSRRKCVRLVDVERIKSAGYAFRRRVEDTNSTFKNKAA